MSFEFQEDRFTALRREMVERQLRARGIRDERLLTAIGRVPRHLFIDEARRHDAYEDHPVSIGLGQTISQPLMVAAMLQLMELNPEDVVLEVGAGTGYEAAVLAELASRVYTVERHAELAEAARENLSRLGYENATVLVGDGSFGLPECAPFDGIVVAAAALRIPEPLVEQLKEGGRLVIPVGPPAVQTLTLVRKLEGEPIVSSVGQCSFVPLIGEGMGTASRVEEK